MIADRGAWQPALPASPKGVNSFTRRATAAAQDKAVIDITAPYGLTRFGR
jgi:hypothetical protein